MSNTRWSSLTTVYLATQVLCVMLHLTPLGYLVLWRKHAYIERLHAKLMIIRGQFMAVFCTFLIHEFPVWQGGLDSLHNGCWPLWITGHVAFSVGLLAEIFSLLHMWLVYTIDYFQSSTANVLACEYQGVKAITLTKTVSGHRDRLSSSCTSSSNPVAVMSTIPRSYKLDVVSTLLARLSLWIFYTPGTQVTRQEPNGWVLRSTRPEGHLPVVTVALAFRTRSKLLGVFAWLFALAGSIASKSLILPNQPLLPSSMQACTANDFVGLTYLATITAAISLMIVVATHSHRARCTEEMRFLRWTCGWRVVSFAFLTPCYLATWLHVPVFQGVLAMCGPWVFPAVWETCSGALRSWSPVLIVWLQRRRDQLHWANLPESRLRKVLEDPIESVAFGDYCARHHCSEAYRFYVDYQQLMVIPAAASSSVDAASSFCARKASLLSPHMGRRLLHGIGCHQRDGSGSIASQASSSKQLVGSIVDRHPPVPQCIVTASLKTSESATCPSASPPDAIMYRQSLFNPPPNEKPDITISIELDSPTSTTHFTHRGAPSIAAIAPFLEDDDVEAIIRAGPVMPGVASNAHDSFNVSPGPTAGQSLPRLPSDPLPVRLGYFSSQYIKQGAPREVNISAASRLQFVQAMEDARYSPDATSSLAHISEHVFRVMVDGVFVRYCEEEYRQVGRKRDGRKRALAK